MIIIFYFTQVEKFPPPSNNLFNKTGITPKKSKYYFNDIVRFHNRLNTNKFENDDDYYYGYDIPNLTNFNNLSSQNKYKQGIYGVDINRRTWPAFIE